jgi:3-oxoadipate enol-lactonase
MPTARVNHCDIYYEAAGAGPPVVFIPGETHGIELFEHQLPHFARRFRCVSYYRRGHGKSGCPPYGYSLWNQTQDLVALLDHLGVERAAIVAVAMSTTVAATYALLRPGRVRGLVLASWYELDGYPLLEERRRKHPVSFAELHLMMGRMLEAEGREALARYLDENYERVLPIFPRDAAVRAKLARMFASHPREHYVQSAEFYTSIPDLVREMARIACPILGICGDEDPSPDEPERLAHLPNFRQAWIKGARRFTMMEQPEAFNREIGAFLDGLPN